MCRGGAARPLYPRPQEASISKESALDYLRGLMRISGQFPGNQAKVEVSTCVSFIKELTGTHAGWEVGRWNTDTGNPGCSRV